MKHIRKLDKITFKALAPEFRLESASSWSQIFEQALQSESGKNEEFDRWRTAFSDASKKLHDKKIASGDFYSMRIVCHILI